MSREAAGSTPLEKRSVGPFRAAVDVFLISVLILFLELACIRWFPAHVLFLTFFTNTVLLACFLGMSVGCLAAGQARNYLVWTPLLLSLGMATAHGVEYLNTHELPRWLLPGAGGSTDETHLPRRLQVDVGNQASPQLVFFGTEYGPQDVARFWIPVEALGGFFFLVLALTLIGPGQELGRALRRVPNRVVAYTLNILGSVAGIGVFALCAWMELAPTWWFLLIILGIGYFLVSHTSRRWSVDRWALLGNVLVALGLVIWLAIWTSGYRRVKGQPADGHFWSPYYRIDYESDQRLIRVNLIGHQQMVSRADDFSPAYAYALPHLLNRDSGGSPFRDVLVIGAGSGNDVSRALQWGAERVDAVEIDPVIARLGRKDHPDRPYEDARVRLHLDDGRNYLRRAPRQYDLIIYALVDSLVLHSSYSNIRLESYLFTRQAFEDVKRCLKPDGVFVMYNYFRQGWIVARLQDGLEAVFGERPLVLTFPYQARIEAEQASSGYTMFFAHNTRRLAETFRRHPAYWVAERPAPSPRSPNGFEQDPGAGEQDKWVRLGLAEVDRPPDVGMATDTWPFLYLRRPMLPDLSVRGMAIMGGLALVLIFIFLPRRSASPEDASIEEPVSRTRRFAFNPRMFFLGAGFMLVETKAVVHMALLFGSTWMVNSIVFFAILLTILAANLFVLAVRPARLWPFYVGLILSLGLNVAVPLDFFLGMNRIVQVTGSCLLVFAPVLFAGVIFAVLFSQSREPDWDFGANIAGAILGGLAEYTSMLIGFQYLLGVAVAFYLLSAIPAPRHAERAKTVAEV